MFGLASISLGAVALVAASFLTNIMTILTPIFKGIAELIVWFIQTLWDGLKSIFANLNTLAVILVLCLASAHYGKTLDNDSIVRPYVQDVKILEKAFKDKKTKVATLPKKVNGHYYVPPLKSWLGL